MRISDWSSDVCSSDLRGTHDLAQLRSLQDWFLKYELITLPNVAEVATIGGMVKQYQVVLDPLKMASLAVTQAEVIEAIGMANQEPGGAVLDLAETEYMVRASGYLQTLEDFRQIPLQLSASGVPVTLGDVAHIQLGPEMRRGIAELDGDGRSEEHTSELQSLMRISYAVFCLKTKKQEHPQYMEQKPYSTY